MIITCPNCEHEYSDIKPQSKPVEGSNSLFDYFLVCPNCQHETFTHRDSIKLRHMRVKLRSREKDYHRKPSEGKLANIGALRGKYQAAFDALQLTRPK